MKLFIIGEDGTKYRIGGFDKPLPTFTPVSRFEEFIDWLDGMVVERRWMTLARMFGDLIIFLSILFLMGREIPR